MIFTAQVPGGMNITIHDLGEDVKTWNPSIVAKQIEAGFWMFLDLLGILLPLVIGIMSEAMIRIPICWWRKFKRGETSNNRNLRCMISPVLWGAICSTNLQGSSQSWL